MWLIRTKWVSWLKFKMQLVFQFRNCGNTDVKHILHQNQNTSFESEIWRSWPSSWLQPHVSYRKALHMHREAAILTCSIATCLGKAHLRLQQASASWWHTVQTLSRYMDALQKHENNTVHLSASADLLTLMSYESRESADYRRVSITTVQIKP